MVSLALLQDSLKESDKKDLNIPPESISRPLSERVSNLSRIDENDYENTILGPMKKLTPQSKKQFKQELMEKSLKNFGPGQLIKPFTGMSGEIIPSLESLSSKIIPKSVQQSIENLPGTLQDLLRYGGKTLTGTAVGSTMSEHPEEDLSKNVLISGATSAIPFGIKQVGRLAEAMIPQQYAKDLAVKINKLGEEVKAKYNKFYQPILDKFGKNEIDLSNIKSIYDEYSYLLSPDTKTAYKKLLKENTFSNAHTFQKQAGQDIGKLSDTKQAKAINQDKIQATRNIRESALDSMKSSLPKKYVKDFEMGSDIFKVERLPFVTGNIMKEISKGKFKNVNVKSLEKALSNLELDERLVSESRLKELGLSKEHPLKKELEKFQEKIQKGKALTSIVPGIAGSIAGAIGGTVAHPGAGTALGAAGGGLLGGYGSSLMEKMYGISPLSPIAQNPYIQKTLSSMQPGYEKLSRSAMELLKKYGF